MLTIICDEPKVLHAVQREKPARAPGEALVRIRCVGVCGTDLHIFAGNQPYLTYPRVMGHELSGIIEEAAEGSTFVAGDPVAVVPYLSCGTCHACQQGKTNCCRNIQVLGVHRDGGMTEYLSIPEAFLLKVDGLTLDQAAMLEFLAIGAHAVRRSGLAPGARVLVVGAGPIGMAVAVFAGLRGGSVVVMDTRADRLAFCDAHLAVAATVLAGPDDQDRLSTLTDGNGFDTVFEATGNPKAMERGFAFVAHGGTYVLVSIVNSNITFFDPEFHKRETSLLSSRNATPEDFETVIAAMRARAIPSEALHTHRMTLSEVPEKFAGLLDPAAGVVKALIEV